MGNRTRNDDAMRGHPIRGALLAALFAAAGCAASVPYLYNETGITVHATADDLHAFTYIRVYADRGEGVLYGKVEHRHDRLAEAGHVDLAVVAADGRTERVESLPLRAVSPKQHGWIGAAFRTRLCPGPSPGSRLFLAFHEAGGGASSGDCEDNAALQTVPAPGANDAGKGR